MGEGWVRAVSEGVGERVEGEEERAAHQYFWRDLPPSSHAGMAHSLLGTAQLQHDELISELISELRAELPVQLVSHI